MATSHAAILEDWLQVNNSKHMANSMTACQVPRLAPPSQSENKKFRSKKYEINAYNCLDNITVKNSYN